MTRFWLDTETYSDVPLNHGTDVYADASETMLWTYAHEDDQVKLWDVTTGAPMPREVEEARDDPSVEVWAHNSFFDRTVTRKDLRVDFAVPIERWRCTMVQAFAHGLPGKLGKLGEILGLPEDEQKMKEGRELIHLFCKPRPKNSKLRRATSETHPEEWDTFKRYAIRDTESMRAIAKLLPSWNYPDNRAELEAWFLDQHINDRGVLRDGDLARAAVRAVKKEKARLNAETYARTEQHVAAASQRDKLLAYLLLEYNVDLPDLTSDTIERRINDQNLPDSLRELLAIRLESSMTSHTKYQRAIDAASPDGRVRGALQFCGAQRTGRWAGRILQPQNFVRPTLKQEVIDEFISALKAGCEDLVCA